MAGVLEGQIIGLRARIWTRDIHQMQTFTRGIEAGWVWANRYHLYPTHVSFGGQKKSGIGRETHKVMLNHYHKTKNMSCSRFPPIPLQRSLSCPRGDGEPYQ